MELMIVCAKPHEWVRKHSIGHHIQFNIYFSICVSLTSPLSCAEHQQDPGTEIEGACRSYCVLMLSTFFGIKSKQSQNVDEIKLNQEHWKLKLQALMLKYNQVLQFSDFQIETFEFFLVLKLLFNFKSFLFVDSDLWPLSDMGTW